VEGAPPAAGPGTVVLDIGGDIGAAVVEAPADLCGREVEMRPAGGEWTGRHVAFHRRATAAGEVVAAVFSPLPAGRWEVRLLGDPSSPVRALDVAGGRVARGSFPVPG
jgi:hypothetical protein